MPSVGLTGGIATGKSTVARFFEERGAAVLDADRTAKQVVAPGSRAYELIVRRFGLEILSPGGEIDRRKLAGIVFADEDAKKDLERITHPYIFDELSRRASGLDREHRFVVIEAALILQTREKWTGDLNLDALVLVVSNTENRIARLSQGRGLSREEAIARIRAGSDAQRHASGADHVLINDGTLQELERAAAEAWADLQARLG